MSQQPIPPVVPANLDLDTQDDLDRDTAGDDRLSDARQVNAPDADTNVADTRDSADADRSASYDRDGDDGDVEIVDATREH